MEWQEITKEEWQESLNKLGEDREVFTTCTDPDSFCLTTPYVMTEWGPKGSKEPTLRAENKKFEEWEDWEYFYFKAITSPTESEGE